MIVKCDSDTTAFILHCTFTSVFCLRHECRKLKASVLMILAISDMMAVLCRKFADVVFQNEMWSDFACMCRHPQVLLQIGKVLFDKTNLGDTKKHNFLSSSVVFTLIGKISWTLNATYKV